MSGMWSMRSLSGLHTHDGSTTTTTTRRSSLSSRRELNKYFHTKSSKSGSSPQGETAHPHGGARTGGKLDFVTPKEMGFSQLAVALVVVTGSP